MKNGLIVTLTCAGLITPIVQAANYSAEPGDYIETLLCGTGQLIRIPLGEPEKDTPPQNHQACHAVCARDQNEEDSGFVV